MTNRRKLRLRHARSAKPGVDPDKIAKLKQKMKEQGMIDENQ